MFNVVQGDKVAVDAILEHRTIAAVSFVGSTPIARYIYETGTRNGKRVQALGGAKNHMIVLPDADVDMAADAAVSAGYGSAGGFKRSIVVPLLFRDGLSLDGQNGGGKRFLSPFIQHSDSRLAAASRTRYCAASGFSARQTASRAWRPVRERIGQASGIR